LCGRYFVKVYLIPSRPKKRKDRNAPSNARRMMAGIAAMAHFTIKAVIDDNGISTSTTRTGIGRAADESGKLSTKSRGGGVDMTSHAQPKAGD